MNSKFYTPLETTAKSKIENFGFKRVSKTLLIILALAYSSSIFAQSIPLAPTSVTATPAAVCQGNSTSLKAVSAGNTIQWYTVMTDGTPIGTSASGANFSVSPSVATTYYAEAFSPLAVASATRTAITITVNTLPVISSVPADIMTTNEIGQCGKVVSYPSVVAVGIPSPNILYSNASGSNFEVGTTTVLTTAVNSCGNSSLSFDVTVNDNEPPLVVSPPDISISAPVGSTSVSGINLGTPTAYDNCGSVTITNDAPSVFPGGVTVVTWTATDSYGHTTTATQMVNVAVTNTAPQISGMATSSAGNLLAAGSSTALTVNWTDEATGGPYAVEVNWNDNSSPTILTGINIQSATLSHTYTNSGIYEPIIKVTDGSNAVATTTFQYIVVYVTGNQFSTGGGNFTAPLGSLTSNSSLSGKVNMGSNCKPSNSGGFQGNMEMNFQGGNIKFKSASPTSWDYLTIGGCYLAAFKGWGTVNGTGNYGILVVQSDKDRNPSCANKVRIKIWNKNAGNAVIFDTQPGDAENALPTTTVQGAIQVHVNNDCSARLDGEIPADGTISTLVLPNPFTSTFTVMVNSLSDDKVQIEIYDMVGKLMQSIDDVNANMPFTVENNYPAGMYFVRISQGANMEIVKMLKNQ
ncbi:hypothetical protein LBMAG27_16780 [Bacteroidota bacterium]|nr:hypothetical protein LBMAG27_16780 [Bacteroidota bacterium]